MLKSGADCAGLEEQSPRDSGPRARIPSSRLLHVPILVVEDDPDGRDLLVEILSREGASVSAASDVAEALETLARVRTAIIVSDIGLPDEDGYAFIKRLRAQEAQGALRIPAIALTAFQRPEDRRRALEAGFDAHLSKPLRTGELFSTIATLLATGST